MRTALQLSNGKLVDVAATSTPTAIASRRIWSWARCRWGSIIDVALVASVPAAALLLSEGMTRSLLAPVGALGALWVAGGVRWAATGIRGRSGWSRLAQPFPMALALVLVGGLGARVGEVAFRVSQTSLESHAEALLVESAESATTVDGCTQDGVTRFGVLFAEVSCFPDQVIYKTSVRPAENGGHRIGGFVYSNTETAYLYGPCTFKQVSPKVQRFSCWQFQV